MVKSSNVKKGVNFSEIEGIVNSIAELYDPYVEKAREIIYKHVEWFGFEKNIGVLGLFYIEDSMRFNRSRKSGRKIYPLKELGLLDFNLEFYIASYSKDHTTTIREAKMA